MITNAKTNVINQKINISHYNRAKIYLSDSLSFELYVIKKSGAKCSFLDLK